MNGEAANNATSRDSARYCRILTGSRAQPVSRRRPKYSTGVRRKLCRGHAIYHSTTLPRYHVTAYLSEFLGVDSPAFVDIKLFKHFVQALLCKSCNTPTRQNTRQDTHHPFITIAPFHLMPGNASNSFKEATWKLHESSKLQAPSNVPSPESTHMMFICLICLIRLNCLVEQHRGSAYTHVNKSNNGTRIYPWHSPPAGMHSAPYKPQQILHTSK